MTLREYLTVASDKVLADLLLQTRTEEDWDYDYEENPVYYGSTEYFVTTDGEEFSFMGLDAYTEAIKHQIKLLDTEYNKLEEEAYDLFR